MYQLDVDCRIDVFLLSVNVLDSNSHPIPFEAWMSMWRVLNNARTRPIKYKSYDYVFGYTCDINL